MQVEQCLLDPSNPAVFVRPEAPYGDIASWIAGHKDGRLHNILAENGAILFRGFPVRDEAAFQVVVDAVTSQRVAYIYRSTPRREVADRIYTATEYPPEYEIQLHNENAYQRDWPMRLLFCCLTPAEQGGETPLASTRGVTSRIDPSVIRNFAEKQVMYVRNYGLGVDLPWETVFQTKDCSEVERYCASRGIQMEWRSRNVLRTWQVCQALAHHPYTREELWFNQAHLFHISNLDDKTRLALLRLLKEEDLPRNAFYGDGSPLEEDVLEHIRAAYRAEKTSFRWEAGDVLLLDNMLVCHGRNSFRGRRKVVTAFADMFSTAVS